MTKFIKYLFVITLIFNFFAAPLYAKKEKSFHVDLIARDAVKDGSLSYVCKGYQWQDSVIMLVNCTTDNKVTKYYKIYVPIDRYMVYIKEK